MTMGYIFWYGYHVPAVRRRDMFYEKLEKERVAKYGGIPHNPLVLSHYVPGFCIESLGWMLIGSAACG